MHCQVRNIRFIGHILDAARARACFYTYSVMFVRHFSILGSNGLPVKFNTNYIIIKPGIKGIKDVLGGAKGPVFGPCSVSDVILTVGGTGRLLSMGGKRRGGVCTRAG